MSDLTEEQIEWAGEAIDQLGGAEPQDWFVIYGREAERREAVADAFQQALHDLPPEEMEAYGWQRPGEEPQDVVA